MAKEPKTLEELTGGIDLTKNEIRQLERVLKLAQKHGATIQNTFKSDKKYIREVISNLEKYEDKLEDQIKLLAQLDKLRQVHARNDKKLADDFEKVYQDKLKQLEEHLELQKELTEEQRKQAEQVARYGRIGKLAYETIEGAIGKVVKQSEDLFKISHDLQIQGNMTWNQYTKLYNDSFEAVREMNREIGQSVINTRQLFEAQQKLVPAGWKGIDTENLTDLSQAIVLINSTLGVFPEELSTAFQMSFRQFEDQTDRFVYAIGNRLNAFSNTFGTTVGALTGAVTQMMAANTYLARNNMTAQITANESLMQAVALSSAVGIETSNFMVGLAKTAQFGTASEMSQLYQTGALLQGFSVGDFQRKMQGRDYMGGTMDLISAIQGTLGGMEPGYLRNEYMKQISQGFGLGQDDILQIMSNDFNLSEKALEIQEKLVDVDTSMEKELRELKVGLIDRLDNWWDSTKLSQGLGKVMQDLGLTGVGGKLNTIIAILLGQSLQSYLQGKGTDALTSLLKSGGQMVGPGAGVIGTGAEVAGAIEGAGTVPLGAGASPTVGATGIVPGGAPVVATENTRLTGMQKFGRVAGGVGIGVGTNMLGRHFQRQGTTGTEILGGTTNILGGIGGGALAGSAFGPWGPLVGGIIGGIGGIINTVVGYNEAREQERQQLEAAEAQSRLDRRLAGQTIGDDPVLREMQMMNRQLGVLIGSVEGGFAMDREITIETLQTQKAFTGGK